MRANVWDKLEQQLLGRNSPLAYMKFQGNGGHFLCLNLAACLGSKFQGEKKNGKNSDIGRDIGKTLTLGESPILGRSLQ